MSSSTWQDHFKEQLVGLEPPREGSFLEMALNEGRITEKDYLQWATQTHLVPVVSPQYFLDVQPDSSLLEKASQPWRSTFFPVAEWDGHLIIACLEVPAEPVPSCSYVLAHRESLSLWWDKLAEHSNPLEGPDGISFDLGSSNEPVVSLESAPAPSLSFAGVSVAAQPEPTPAIVETEAQPAPTPEVAAVAVAAEIPTKETASDIVLESSFEQTQTRTFISIEPAPIPAPPKQGIALKTNPTLEKHSLSEISIEIATYKSDVQKALTQITGAYPKTMLLVLDESKKNLIPMIWSESFKAPPTMNKIPLGQASIFEIVAATEKSYHGPVIPNEINTQFLLGWNGGAQPETLTITPLLGGGRLRGMILGIGPNSSYTLTILRHVEKVAADLMKTWKLDSQTAA